MYASKLCYRSVGAKPVSGKTDPVYGINKRTLSFVEGISPQASLESDKKTLQFFA